MKFILSIICCLFVSWSAISAVNDFEPKKEAVISWNLSDIGTNAWAVYVYSHTNLVTKPQNWPVYAVVLSRTNKIHLAVTNNSRYFRVAYMGPLDWNAAYPHGFTNWIPSTLTIKKK